MNIWKIVFTVLAIVFGALGLFKIMPFDITLPIMFLFIGLTNLTTAKDLSDRGQKKDAVYFLILAIFVFAVTAFILVSKFLRI